MFSVDELFDDCTRALGWFYGAQFQVWPEDWETNGWARLSIRRYTGKKIMSAPS